MTFLPGLYIFAVQTSSNEKVVLRNGRCISFYPCDDAGILYTQFQLQLKFSSLIPLNSSLLRKIVAIGGGRMIDGATAELDREIISLSGKKKPNALFIPTASSDDADNCDNFKKVYGTKLGCDVDFLLLLKDPPSAKMIRQKISAADIIYVGGGNTLKMMRRWRWLGVDAMLINAANRGKVMAGTSAGAICWFQYGHSDSIAFYHPQDWDWIRVKCLGILPFTACPHVLAEGRLHHFQKMILKKGGVGIALDDCTAMEVVGDQFRIITSKANAKAYKIFKQHNDLITEEFVIDNRFKPVKDIF